MAYPTHLYENGHWTASGGSQSVISHIQHHDYRPHQQAGYSNQASYFANNRERPQYSQNYGPSFQQQPFSNHQNPLPTRSGVAVVIPIPGQHKSQGYKSPSKSAAAVVSKPSLSPARSTNPAFRKNAPAAPPLDYPLLLISLAEEYFAAAHSRGAMVVLSQQDFEARIYYKYLSTGLGCLEAVLKHFRLQPQTEAKVRLRYATVLYEETENVTEAEEALSKGIAICERHRLYNQKYNMQYLLARILYIRNPRASIKFVDGTIQDLEAYQHVAWIYAFRFLRLSLSLNLSSHQDNLAVLNQLRLLSSTAERYGDKGVVAAAMILESLVYLRESSSAESIEQAQRALAAARSLQLDPQVKDNPQLSVLTSFVDLCCTLQSFDTNHAVIKMQAMQTTLEKNPVPHAWKNNGSFEIPISHTTVSPTTGSNGVLRSDSDANLTIVLNWIPREDILALGYLLSSIAIAYRNTSDGQRSEQLLREGLNFLETNMDKVSDVPQSVPIAASRQNWRQLIKCYFILQLAFELCSRTAWAAAREQLERLKLAITTLPSTTSSTLILFRQYLEGIINQGTGSLDIALSVYTSPFLSLSNLQSSPNPVHFTLALLSTLNSILIVRSPSHPLQHQLPALVSSLEPHVPYITTSKPLQSAYNIILATSPYPSPTIVKTKQYLQVALQAAKGCSNNQLMCMTLNFMSWKFFRGVVGEQAEKSARASDNLARKGMDAMWKTVSAGVLGDTLEVAGKSKDAEEVRRQGREIARGLPKGVQRWNGDEDVRETSNQMEGVEMEFE